MPRCPLVSCSPGARMTGSTEGLCEPRLERGVIYRAETERVSHYFGARLPDQFDAVLHFDETRAVEPLECTAEWEAGEPPATFPSACRTPCGSWTSMDASRCARALLKHWHGVLAAAIHAAFWVRLSRWP
jgi:hypothetical protein